MCHAVSVASENAAALAGQDDQNVSAPARAFDKTVLLRTVHQFNRTVMANVKLSGQRADGRFNAFGEPLNRKQQLILTRLQPCGPRRAVAGVQISANVIPEFRQGPILFRACLGLSRPCAH